MIQFENVSKRYNKSQDALSNVSFQLNQGEMAFLTGHSGAGKSTILKLIALIERVSAGQIIVNHQNLNRCTKRKVPDLRKTMGIIFQDPKLIKERRVFDNVALPLVISNYHPREIARRVRAALDKVGLLHKEKSFPDELSSGEQQRVGIARAVVNKPNLLLADEPTGNLDPNLSAEIMRLFEQFNQVGVALLIASHDLSLIASLQHRIITLDNGKLVNDGLRGESS